MFIWLLQVGYDMTKVAAKRAYESAGLTPADVDVVELHDCFSANELITYEALGETRKGRRKWSKGRVEVK